MFDSTARYFPDDKTLTMLRISQDVLRFRLDEGPIRESIGGPQLVFSAILAETTVSDRCLRTSFSVSLTGYVGYVIALLWFRIRRCGDRRSLRMDLQMSDRPIGATEENGVRADGDQLRGDTV
jgi:hypothetical protein